MNLTKVCSNILNQPIDVVEQLNESTYSAPSHPLSNSTIGQHFSHTLEFLICFEEGYHTGSINYDKRAHDKTIEREKHIAIQTIHRINEFIHTVDFDKPLLLEVNYDLEKDTNETLTTTAKRELVYNIEHAVHHMAIIKIGIKELAPRIILPPEFGIAASTIRHIEVKTIGWH